MEGGGIPELWPAAALAAAIRKRELGCRELLERYLERIERHDGAINAVVTRAFERARREADAADRAVADGDDLGPLHGLPITVKDAIETEGIRSTGGAVELRDHVPDADAPAVSRLRSAGAIVMGKTNVPRWSGDFQTYNDLFGTTNNPWDAGRTTGGSSGGPAAAVASGFTAFELGTDIGGSVRVPSHFCGVFGLKPSFGVVPQRGYLDHVGGGLTDADINVFGPIARSGDDLDLLLGVLAGPEPERAVAWRLDLPDSTVRSLTGARVAVCWDAPDTPIARSYRSRLDAVADALADAGAHVGTPELPVGFDEQVALFGSLVLGAISPSLPEEQAGALSGSHRAWLRLEETRARVRARWARWFDDWDVFLCPVTCTPAFPHVHEGEMTERTVAVDGVARPYLDNIRWTGFVGVVGLPAAVPPVGPTDDGLPVGVQVVAPFLHDRRAVRFATLLAERVGGYRPPPLDP